MKFLLLLPLFIFAMPAFSKSEFIVCSSKKTSVAFEITYPKDLKKAATFKLEGIFYYGTKDEVEATLCVPDHEFKSFDEENKKDPDLKNLISGNIKDIKTARGACFEASGNTGDGWMAVLRKKSGKKTYSAEYKAFEFNKTNHKLGEKLNCKVKKQ